MEDEIFKNCSGFTDEQITEVANLRCGLASSSCIVLSVLFVSLVTFALLNKSNKLRRPQVCDNVEKRLVICLTAVSTLYEFFLALGILYYFNSSGEAFCKADGFLNQYFGSVQLLFALGISSIIFFKVILKKNTEKKLTCCCGKGMKKEVLFLFVVFIIPALLDLIPFITDSYGSTGPWCWIHSINKNCTTDTAGLAEQIALWNVPFGLMALLTLLLVIGAPCLVCYACCKFGIRRGIVDSLPSLVISLIFLLLTCIMYTAEVAIRSLSSFYHNNLVTWKIYAVSAPLGQLAIPWALLAAVFLPLSCKCKREAQLQEENKTYAPSSFVNIPSETNWKCSHSNTAEEDTPLLQN